MSTMENPRAEGLRGLLLKEERSITQLIDNGTLDAPLAAFLWAALQRRASIIVAAGPRLAGKSTLLHALTAFLPSDTQLYYTRGQRETFDFAATADPARSYVFVSEISDHTPYYLWAPHVARLFELLDSGYGLGATVHADTPEQVIQPLMEYPNDVPGPRIARTLDIVVTLRVDGREDRIKRRVASVYYFWQEPRAPHEIGVRSMASWQSDRDAFIMFRSPEAWQQMGERLGTDASGLQREVRGKANFLTGLVQKGVWEFGEVAEAIEKYVRS